MTISATFAEARGVIIVPIFIPRSAPAVKPSQPGDAVKLGRATRRAASTNMRCSTRATEDMSAGRESAYRAAVTPMTHLQRLPKHREND
jgi:hypothetical protein